MFEKAMREAGASGHDLDCCYFVDDSALNAAGAKAFGWQTAHLVERGISNTPPEPVADVQVESLYKLPGIWPELFKAS